MVFRGGNGGVPLHSPPLQDCYVSEQWTPDEKILSNSMHRMCLGAPGCLRWNSAMSAGAETLEADSQELCSWLYPFHLMRYWNLLWCQRLSSIFSTSYSASLSMTMGSGWSSIFCPGIGSSGARVSFTTLNTGWSCFILCGSFRR